MKSITFTSTNTALQSNVISIIFPLVEDETIYGGFATKYRYRCRYTPLYCGRVSAMSNTYAYYDDEQWTSMSAWTEFITSSGSGQYYGKGQFDFEIPQFDYDVVLSLQVQVYEDGIGSYYDALVGDSYTPVFIGFYNRDFQISLSSVERITSNEQESIHVQGKIDKTNIFKPYNRDEAVKDSAWKLYCSNMINSFLTEGAENDPLFIIRCDASLNSRMTEFESQTILSITRANIQEWYPHSFETTIDIADKWAKFSSQNNVFIQAILAKIFNENSESFEFYTADLSTTSNVLLLSAAISSFQIKRRGVKAQMLENDNNIGTFSTGAGMFNHSNLVGVRKGPLQQAYIKTWDWNQYLIRNTASTPGGKKEQISYSLATDAQLYSNAFPFEPTIAYNFDIADIETLPVCVELEQYDGAEGSLYFLLEGYLQYQGNYIYSLENEWIRIELKQNVGSYSDIYLYSSLDQINGVDNLYKMVRISIGPSKVTADPEKGHSIALYDTHATGDVPSNRPSIGFMDDKHNCQASLVYEGGYLVSSVPIKHPGNDPEGSLGSLQSIELGISNGQIIKIEGYFSVT